MGTDHGVRRLDDGSLEIRLDPIEHELLASFPDQLRIVFGGSPRQADADADTDRTIADVRARLYPPASHDDDIASAYQDLLGDALLAERLDRLDAFTAILAEGAATDDGWTTRVDADAAESWLATLNDARLVLGVVCGITDERSWERLPQPDAAPVQALHWLGWLQEETVAAMTGSLDHD